MTNPEYIMSDKKPALVPKLRFPEFRGQQGWKETRLHSVLTEHGQKDDGTSEVHSVSVHKGVVNQVEHLGRSFAAADRSNYNLGKPYDIIYTKSPTGDFPYGIVKQNKLSYNVIVSPLYGVFSPLNAHLGYLLDAYFESPVRTNNYLAPITQKGAKNTIQISNTTFLSNGIYLPKSEAEYKKIADFLSTLDELVLLERQKLDALKAHKKWLMQQLFPRHGETLPRLRFPEFQGAPEWKSDLLGEIFNTASGGTPSRTEKTYWNGQIPWITTSLVDFRVITHAEEFITESGLENSSAKLFPKGTVLMAMYGQGKTRGQVALLDIEATTNQACAAILPRHGIDPYFVLLNLAGRYEEIRGMSNPGGQENLSQELVRKIPFAFPPDEGEQRKVTACLSSLDSLITAQCDKLVSLKTHKNSLMQQLFPSLEASAT